jgi:hypothetical protein
MQAILTNVPQKLQAFVGALTNVPAKGFTPIVQTNQIEASSDGDEWEFSFKLKPKTKIHFSMVYPWVPKHYRCSEVAIIDGFFKVSLCPKYVN